MKLADTGRGFTLIELLAALLVLALLALMSYRAMGAVLDARSHVARETEKWQRVAAFNARFEQDIRLAVPRPVRNGAGKRPAWMGNSSASPGLLLEFTRFASAEGVDAPRRVAYALNERQEIELWLWSGIDLAFDTLPTRHILLNGVRQFEIQYLTADNRWVVAWPKSPEDSQLPKAVRLQLTLASGEEIVRIFALNS